MKPNSEILNRVFDSSRDALRVLADQGYMTNDVELLDNVIYVGKEAKDGRWVILKLSFVGELISVRAASETNNPTITTYSDAWSSRTVLVYGYLKEVV